MFKYIDMKQAHFNFNDFLSKLHFLINSLKLGSWSIAPIFILYHRTCIEIFNIYPVHIIKI